VGDDGVSKYRHTVSVFAVLTAALIALSTSGLHGSVVIDPAQPVCMVGQPCSAPDRHDVLAFWQGDRRVAQTKTDADGHYRVSLPPGTYRVRAPRHGGIGRGLEPSRVIVPRGRYARANFTLDIGIR
jgi:Carboxypeptidase regulatory-like domain